jgi:CRP/FNR family transcriptional regulator, cyclic AMP receptor protein
MNIKSDKGKTEVHTEETPALRTAITKHPFFRGLSADHLQVLADCAMQTEFHRDDLIFRQGDVANRFYLIEAGRVALETDQRGDGTIRIQTLGAGDTLGWSWLFPPHVWRFSARALETTRAIFFYGTWLRERCEHDPGFSDELMRRTAQVVVERLQATQLQLVEISQVALKAQLQALQMTAPAGHSASARKN